MTPNDEEPTPGGRTLSPRVLAIGALVLLVIVAGIVLLTRGGDDSASTAGGSPSSSSDPATTSASPSGSASASPTKKPKKTKGTKASTSASSTPVLSAEKPLRATFKQTAKPAPSLVVGVSRVEKVQAKAEIPGEVSGPALRITVTVRNTSNKTVPIKTALTNLYYGPDRTPATQMTKPGSKNFPERVRPGQTVTGVVLYTVPRDERGRIALEVIIDAQMRRIEFQADCSASC